MATHSVVSHDEWVAARKALLAREKEFTRARDALSVARRDLPWEEIEDYRFASASGEARLSALFAGRSQLIIYHLMFHPDWNAACKSCSFWADNFERITVHLKARDVSFAAVSRAPVEKLEAFKARMGWSFPWVSCGGEGAFNRDFGTAFTAGEIAAPDNNYNYGTIHFRGEDAPGLSVFVKDESGGLYHSYSTYARGLDMLNVAYHYLDIVPKGRDEASFSHAMSWVRLRDEYGADAAG